MYTELYLTKRSPNFEPPYKPEVQNARVQLKLCTVKAYAKYRPCKIHSATASMYMLAGTVLQATPPTQWLAGVAWKTNCSHRITRRPFHCYVKAERDQIWSWCQHVWISRPTAGNGPRRRPAFQFPVYTCTMPPWSTRACSAHSRSIYSHRVFTAINRT